jgi:hypothetical protein
MALCLTSRPNVAARVQIKRMMTGIRKPVSAVRCRDQGRRD